MEQNDRPWVQIKVLWRAPETRTVKINVNGAIFSSHIKAGTGCVLQNEKGKVLMAATNPEMHYEDPLTMEFLAILRGLRLCIPLGLQRGSTCDK